MTFVSYFATVTYGYLLVISHVKATTGRGVCEAHLHEFYKPCVIEAISSQTQQTWSGFSTTVHYSRFVMVLLQCLNDYKLGEDEFQDPPRWP